MKTCYMYRPPGGLTTASCICDIIPASGLSAFVTYFEAHGYGRELAVISRIHTTRESTRRGWGTLLLGQVLSDADEEGITLIFEPQPYDGMPLHKLVEWYERHGFIWGSPEKAWMARRPVQTGRS